MRQADEPALPPATVGAGGAAVWQRDEAPPLAIEGEGAGPAVGWPELTEWVRRRRVVVAALLLIAFELWWKGTFLGHFFFWQDDFRYLDRGLDNGLTWKYLMWVDAGHLIPGPFAVSWILARAALYDWALASALSLAMVAAAGLALLRLLRNLFGDRPAILIPLAFYVFTPLTLPDLGWWSSAVESVPLQLATIMALDSHVRFVRTARYRHAAAAAAWMALGMLFFEKGMVVPLLLFAVTSAFFIDGRWLAAAGRALTRYWRVWLLYAGVLVAYAAVLALQLHAASGGPGSPGSYRGVLTFVSRLVDATFIPGALGGPWRWQSSGSLGYSAPPGGLLWLFWLVAAAIVVASVVYRKYAWRAWLIVAGWLAAADMAPVIIGRTRVYGGSLLAMDTRYVADAAAVLAICLGLAYLPIAGRLDTRRRLATPVAAGRATPRAVGAVLGAFILGSLWSAQAYENVTTEGAQARAYVTNARAALAAAPYGTVIVDQRVPSRLVLGIFGRYAYASKVIGEMAQGVPPNQLRWTRNPLGTIDHLMVFGSDGRLREAAVVGVSSRPQPAGRCWAHSHGDVVVAVPRVTTFGTWTLRVGYYAQKAEQVSVLFGSQAQQLTLRPGLHNVYLPVQGTATSITVGGPGAGSLCVGNAAVGVVFAAASGPEIPAAASGPQIPAAGASG